MNVLRTIELYALNECILWCGNCISLKMFKLYIVLNVSRKFLAWIFEDFVDSKRKLNYRYSRCYFLLQEILASVMIKNLDTGEEIPLSLAEEKLPTGINPLTLHIMRRTKEYVRYGLMLLFIICSISFRMVKSSLFMNYESP